MAESYGVQVAALGVDDIFAADFPVIAQAVTLEAGQGALLRGTVLGIKLTAAVAAKVSGTGDGNVAAAAVTLGRLAQAGVYTLTCTAAATNAGTFKVQAPDGRRLPALTVGTAYSGDEINLTVPDGATDWGVGAVISVTVTGKAVVYDPAASNGAEVARLILADDLTVGAADMAALAYRTGCFARNQLAGIDDAAVAALDARSIFVR